MEEARIERMEASFKLLAPRGKELVDLFYTRLFEKHENVRELFPNNMMGQQGKLLSTLVLLVSSLRNLEKLMGTLQELGRRHVEYGVLVEHYPYVRDTLVEAMAELAGEHWTDQLQEDWLATLNTVATVMLSDT